MQTHEQWAISVNPVKTQSAFLLSDLSQAVRMLDSAMECEVVWVQSMYLSTASVHQCHIRMGLPTYSIAQRMYASLKNTTNMCQKTHLPPYQSATQ